MDPNNPGPQEYGSADEGGPGEEARTTRLVVGDHVLTVNPAEASAVRLCAPGERPAAPRRRTPQERAALDRPGTHARHGGPLSAPPPLVEREEERRRIAELLGRGRTVRVTGRPGIGRSTLLDAAVFDAAEFAPDGVVRLSGYHRTPSDLLHELFATVFDASALRLGRDQLHEAVARIGAVVVLDDVEFGGAVLDDLLDATPECAFLLATAPEAPPPSARSRVEEVALSGISRTGCLELLEHLTRRPLTDEETDWAADLWFESEGLPLRFVQAGALLRQRDALRSAPDPDDRGVFTGEDGAPELPTFAGGVAPVELLVSWLPEAARSALRLAVALDGDLPDEAHLSALLSAPEDASPVGSPTAELLSRGLATTVGHRHRLADGVWSQLSAAGYQDGWVEWAEQAAQHYAWWCRHFAVTPREVAAEADPLLRAMRGVQRGGRPTTAVLLARAAAPMFAAALHWNAWETALRIGQEAARQSGQVAEEAYLHHELGVLALCTGNLGRAQTELEASIALHGVLADRRGALAGRRVLALVEECSTPLGGGAPESADPARPPAAADGTPVAGVPAALGSGSGADPSPGSGERDGEPTTALRRPGRTGVLRGTRRNLLAAGAGVLLVAVFGTVVALTGASDDGGGTESPERVPPDRASAQPDDLGAGGLDARPSTPASASGSERTSPSGEPSDAESPSAPPSSSSSSSAPASPSGTSTAPSSPSEDGTPGGSSGGAAGGTSGGGGSGGSASGGGSGSNGGGTSNGSSGGSDGGDGGGSEGTDGGTTEGDEGGASDGGSEGGEGGTSEGGGTEGNTGGTPSDSASAAPSRSQSDPSAGSPSAS